MSQERSRREFLKAISLAGAAAITGASVPKEAQASWCTNDIDFDQEGCLYIKNVDLAHAIQNHIDALGGHLYLRRDGFPNEVSEDGGTVEGRPVNSMCPC
jgi:hypothetical protein